MGKEKTIESKEALNENDGSVPLQSGVMKPISCCGNNIRPEPDGVYWNMGCPTCHQAVQFHKDDVEATIAWNNKMLSRKAL